MTSFNNMTSFVFRSQSHTRFLHLLPGGPGGLDVYNQIRESLYLIIVSIDII